LPNTSAVTPVASSGLIIEMRDMVNLLVSGEPSGWHGHHYRSRGRIS
jgi:hypothetical protein